MYSYVSNIVYLTNHGSRLSCVMLLATDKKESKFMVGSIELEDKVLLSRIGSS